MSRPLLVDAHVHVFTRDMPLIDNPRHSPKYSFTHEQLIATLDEHGIDRAVIAAASPWGDYNDYTIAALRAHPTRLRGTVILKPSVDRYALEAMSRDGVVGVRLPYISLPQLPDLASFEYRSFFRRLADLDWHVHPHIEGERLPQVLPALEASGVKIVIDHLGRPEPRQGINGEGFMAMLRSVDKGRTWVRFRPATGSARPPPTTLARCSASPDPSGWYGRATARSSGMRASSAISPPSIGSAHACRTRLHGA